MNAAGTGSAKTGAAPEGGAGRTRRTPRMRVSRLRTLIY
jgi:hypothetical protein